MKLTFVFFTIAVCFAMGLGFWLSFSAPLVTEEDLREVGAVPAVPAAPSNETSGRESLLTLLERRETEECSFRLTNDDLEAEGTAFTSGTQLRMDAVTDTTTNNPSVTSVIITPEQTYVWQVVGTTTVAFARYPSSDALAQRTEPALTLAATLISPDTRVQYNCAPWRLDASVFTPPRTRDADLSLDVATSSTPQ